MDIDKIYSFSLDKTLKSIQQAYLCMFKKYDVDLSVEQWVILQRVHLLDGETSQAELAKDNFRNRATTSRLITGLCEKGYLTKSRFEGDCKRFKISITAKGKQLIDKIDQPIKELRQKGYQNIAPSDLEILLNVLEQIQQNYNLTD